MFYAAAVFGFTRTRARLPVGPCSRRQSTRKGHTPSHIHVTHRSCCNRGGSLRSAESANDPLGTLGVILEVVGIQNVSRLYLVRNGLGLCVLGWVHAKPEYVIIFVHRGTRSAGYISFSLISDLLCNDGGLIATKRLHGSTNVEGCWYVFQFHLIDGQPIIQCCCCRNKPTEVGTCRQCQRSPNRSEFSFESTSLDDEISGGGSTWGESYVELRNIRKSERVRQRHT